jgi:hypothetical protein
MALRFLLAAPWIALAISLALPDEACAAGKGRMNPVFGNLTRSASFREESGQPVYTYSLTHAPPDNAAILSLRLDVSTSHGIASLSGTGKDALTATVELRLREKGIGVVAVQALHEGRTFGTPHDIDGSAMWWVKEVEAPKSLSRFDGYELRVIDPRPTLPGIRIVRANPRLWLGRFDHILPSTDDDDRVIARKRQVIRDLDWTQKSIGPVVTHANSRSHWKRLLAEADEADQRHWFRDAFFSRAVRSELTAAKRDFDARDFQSMNGRLRLLLARLESASDEQWTAEARILLIQNVRALVDAPPPEAIEPDLAVPARSASLPIGQPRKIAATLTDHASGGPLSGREVELVFPATMRRLTATTDSQGVAAFEFTSEQQGTELFHIRACVECRADVPALEISGSTHWTYAADLTIADLEPREFHARPGDPLVVRERTVDHGNQSPPSSVTRYYLSPGRTSDPAQAIVLGARAMTSGYASEHIHSLRYVIPANFPEGPAVLVACADDENEVIEVRKHNNCTDAAFGVLRAKQAGVE